MAKRPPAAEPKIANLTPGQMRAAIKPLQRRIAELEAFNSREVRDRSDPRIATLEAAIDDTLTTIFDPSTVEYRRYRDARNIDRAPLIIGGTPLHEVIDGLQRGKQTAIALLQQIIKSFEEKLQDGVHFAPTIIEENQQLNTKDIFVVHGHDQQAKAEVARFLEKAGLHPVILHEQPSGGRTVIEKLEHYSNLGFAVVLLTPDDVGGEPNLPTEKLRRRARQNVIGELFYFVGKLGRQKVCALRKGELEMPSDIVGVIYTDMDARGAWKTDLLRELEAAEYEIDWKKALG